MILTHGANSLARGGTPIPSGYEQVWGIYKNYGTGRLEFNGTNNPPPALSGHSTTDCDFEVTFTVKDSPAASEYNFSVAGTSDSHTFVCMGSNSDNSLYRIWASNNDYYSSSAPFEYVDTDIPITDTPTFKVTLYRNTIEILSGSKTFTSDQIGYYAKGYGTVYIFNAFSGNLATPYYVNRVRIIEHLSGNVLFDAIPLKNLTDNKAYFWDAVGGTMLNYSSMVAVDTNPYT